MSACVYRGYLNEPTGIGAAARSHVLALHGSGHPVRIDSVRLAPGGRAADPVDAKVYPEVAAITERGRRARTVLVHTPPENYPVMVEPRAYNVGVAVWETDRLPPTWPEKLRLVDEIWVPSEFNRELFAESSKKPVHVVPHPVVAPPPRSRHFPGVPDDVFLFVSILAWQDRKNPLGLVRAFVRAFRGRSDVALLLKLGWRVGGSAEQAMRALAPLTRGVGPWRAPKVFLVCDEVTPETMAQMYGRADAYVSLHKGEGFGLCMAEAMAAGIPVVATGYSGNLQFMDDESALLVPYDLVGVRQELTHTWFDGAMRWAEPRQDDAIEALRFCVEHPAERRRLADAGRARVHAELSPERVGALMHQRLGEISPRRRIGRSFQPLRQGGQRP